MYSPKEMAENYLRTGCGKTSLPLGKMFVLAILAGSFIALAGVASTCAAVTVESASIAKLLSACVFPAGLAMVLLAGSELFTGNCLLIIPVLGKSCTLFAALRNLVVVFLGNFVGAAAVAWLVVGGHTADLFGGQLAASMIATAAAKCSLSFGDAFIRGILCNFLVSLAVWMSFAAKDAAGKVAALFFPILAFVVAGYEHCVADMYYVPAGLFATADPAYAGLAADCAAGLSWSAFLLHCLLPVTLGNLVGGAGLGLALWYLYLHPAVGNSASVS